MDVRRGRFSALRGDDAVEPAVPPVGLRQAAREWAIIFAVVLAFCLPFLDLGSGRPLTGNEAEIVQSLDWTLVNSLREHRVFPLWNPICRRACRSSPILSPRIQPAGDRPVLLLGVEDEAGLPCSGFLARGVRSVAGSDWRSACGRLAACGWL